MQNIQIIIQVTTLSSTFVQQNKSLDYANLERLERQEGKITIKGEENESDIIKHFLLFHSRRRDL